MTTELSLTAESNIGLELHAGLVASARAYAKASKSERTAEVYGSAWDGFTAWCAGQGASALPAAPETVALFLTFRADAGRKPATIGLDAAAISAAHRAAGLDSPTAHESVRAVLAGIRRTLGTAQRRAAPMLPANLRQASNALPAGLLGLRDRALLLVGFAGALRRGELEALQVEDLGFGEDGLTVTLRRSKTDQEGRGEQKGLPFGSDPATCPVRALRAWLAAAQLTAGPVFREVTRHGRVEADALTGRSIARIVKRSAVGAGLDGAAYSGHSLRAGLATAAAKAGKSVHAIMRQTGHKSADMVARYVREASLFSDNAASGIGL